jgi:hypothetical protein
VTLDPPGRCRRAVNELEHGLGIGRAENRWTRRLCPRPVRPSGMLLLRMIAAEKKRAHRIYLDETRSVEERAAAAQRCCSLLDAALRVVRSDQREIPTLIESTDHPDVVPLVDVVDERSPTAPPRVGAEATRGPPPLIDALRTVLVVAPFGPPAPSARGVRPIGTTEPTT